MANETNYRLKYRKGDFEVDVQGDKTWVENKFKELTEGKLVTMEEAPPKVEGLPESLGEFIRARGNPSKHGDIAIVFSYWLHKKEKMSSYNIDDIEKCYDDTRTRKPKNIGDAMNKAQAKAYLMPASKKKERRKAWVITRAGEEYVEKMT